MTDIIDTPSGPVDLIGYGIIELQGARIFAVHSDSDNQKAHRVSEWNGQWDCSCRATTTCKHIKRVREAVES